MRIQVLDLNGEVEAFNNVTRYGFTNHETYGDPDTVQRNNDSEKLLLINANNYAALLVEGD